MSASPICRIKSSKGLCLSKTMFLLSWQSNGFLYPCNFTVLYFRSSNHVFDMLLVKKRSNLGGLSWCAFSMTIFSLFLPASLQLSSPEWSLNLWLCSWFLIFLLCVHMWLSFCFALPCAFVCLQILCASDPAPHLLHIITWCVPPVSHWSAYHMSSVN